MPDSATLFGSLLFGIIGLAALRIGKRSGSWKTMSTGLALMLFPYAVGPSWLLYTLGCALCAALYFWRN